MLGDRNRQTVGVDFLEGIRTDHRQRHLTGDRHHRDRIELGIGDRGHQIGGARSGRCEAHLGPARDAAHALGHEARTLFVPGQHVMDALALGERVVERQDRAARNSGNGPDALTLEHSNDQLGACHLWHLVLLLEEPLPPACRKNKPPPAGAPAGVSVIWSASCSLSRAHAYAYDAYYSDYGQRQDPGQVAIHFICVELETAAGLI